LEQDTDEENETNHFQRNNKINPPFADDGSIQYFLHCLKVLRWIIHRKLILIMIQLPLKHSEHWPKWMFSSYRD